MKENMKLISHRGNIDGPLKDKENDPNYILKCLDLGYNVEIDVWLKDEKLFLGHDLPQYSIEFNFITKYSDKLWLHCKNVDALFFFLNKKSQNFLNFFWHETDKVALTSQGYVWAYPGTQPIKNSIAVLPEINNDDITLCEGICSDYISSFKK